MNVIKRSGMQEPVEFDKITRRLRYVVDGLDERFVDPVDIAQKVIANMYSGITTTRLDSLAAEICAYQTSKHPDFSLIAGRLLLHGLYKETESSFSVLTERLASEGILSNKYRDFVRKNAKKLNSEIFEKEKSYDLDYFAFKTLEKSYLLKINGSTAERPLHMLMRVSVAIHENTRSTKRVLETFRLMSDKYFVHASPTLFNAGTRNPQLSSCFLSGVEHDSIEGIYDCLKNCAVISKYAGGIGLNVHKVRAKGSAVRGTQGTSNGIVPMLKVFNATARYVDQGGNKRPGAIAIYVEPWHADIEEVLKLKKNTGNEEQRTRDLFYALWIPDLFMERVRDDQRWSLMCPSICSDLCDLHGEDFKIAYENHEREGEYVRHVKARDLWNAILESQVETGGPFMLYKDACNAKSNQKNLGTIRNGNLCTEIIQFSSADEISVCNLASIAVNRCVDFVDGVAFFDFEKLISVTKVVTKNLNKIIDSTYYPIEACRTGTMKHRPIGIGVQGLADAFMALKIAYDSEAARLLNVQIFETIYFGALEASCELASIFGAYESFENSPASQGIFQFNLWGIENNDSQRPLLWNWIKLKKSVMKNGLRNSLLVAQMPTASTAQILGNNDGTEPYTSNIYSRKVLSGDFQIVNRHLIEDLVSLNLWDDKIRTEIIANGGSVKNIDVIPSDLREVYKTVWEINPKILLKMSAERGAFIDQSQSQSIYLENPTYDSLTTLHFYGWVNGLKTGMYYLRTKPPNDSVQFSCSRLTDESRRPNCASCHA